MGAIFLLVYDGAAKSTEVNNPPANAIIRIPKSSANSQNIKSSAETKNK
jgi:hypothetical protein